MTDRGINHVFIVSFKKPIKVSSYEKGITVNLTGGHGIWHTPFALRGMHGNGSLSSVILSNNMMAFDIDCLQTGSFGASYLLESQELLPDERLSQFNEKVRGRADWEKTKKKIDSIFSESDKAKKLLEWIKQSGLSILERGLYRSGDDRIGQYPVDEIIANYTALKTSPPWRVLTHLRHL
jgi:hypothetical protein